MHLSQLNAGDARAPHIGFVVIGGVSTDFTGNDFRGHPVRRANEGGPLVGSLLVLGRHTKVSQTDGAVRTEENIAGLEVSVDTAIGVKEVEGGEQLL